MQLVDLPIDSIIPAPWNPNEMDAGMLSYLRQSLLHFGLLVPLVVRSVRGHQYQTIGGAQRLSVLKELGLPEAPCVIVTADDAEARLLGQALNHIAGSDNLGLRAQVLREILETKSQEEVLALLPETAESLRSLTSIGEESIAQALQHWEQAQKARLRHLAFQLTDSQLEVVEEVLKRLLSLTGGQEQGPNRRGTALYLLCLGYLERADIADINVLEELP